MALRFTICLALKYVNTFVDSWVGSLPSSVWTSIMISGWGTVLGQGYHSDAPPMLSDIVDKKIRSDYLCKIV